MATVTLRPSSDSAIVECSIYPTSPTTHYDKVDEVTPNDATDYVYFAGVGIKRDLFNKPASGIPAGSTINSVTIYNRVKCVIGDYGELGVCYTLLRSGTTDAEGASSSAISWTTISTPYDISPFTGIAWTIAEIDAMLIGTRLYGIMYGDIPTTEYTSTVWIEVDYTPVAVALASKRLLVGVGL